MRKIRARPVFVVRRTRQRLVSDMQKLRQKLLSDLESVFDLAKSYAQDKGEIMPSKQRQAWIRIMAYTGQVMNSLTKSFDESQVAKDLERLERMIDEAMAKETDGRPTATG